MYFLFLINIDLKFYYTLFVCPQFLPRLHEYRFCQRDHKRAMCCHKLFIAVQPEAELIHLYKKHLYCQLCFFFWISQRGHPEFKAIKKEKSVMFVSVVRQNIINIMYSHSHTIHCFAVENRIKATFLTTWPKSKDVMRFLIWFCFVKPGKGQHIQGWNCLLSIWL